MKIAPRRNAFGCSAFGCSAFGRNASAFPPGPVAPLAACTLVALALAAAGGRPALARDPAGWEQHAAVTENAHRPGVIVVKFRHRLDATRKASPELRALLGSQIDTAQPLLRKPRRDATLPGGVDRIYEIQVDPSTDVLLLAGRLARTPEVEYAEPAWVYDLVGRAEPLDVAMVPNDPSYASNQTYLDSLDLEAAWDISRGEIGSPVVCVVDGGTNWQHEDLNANMWVNPGEIPGNLNDDDDNGFVDDVHGWNFQAGNGNPRGNFAVTPGSANHGTHTGGLLAAVTNNGVGIASASFNPRLMAVNAGGPQDNSVAYGFSGILYAAENGADVVSLSWGGTSASQALQDVIDYAVSQGVLVIGAAGNNANDVPFFPAAYSGVYAVANVWGQTGVRYGGANGSGFGGWVDVAAPGAAILSLFDFGTTNSYGSSTGTSMAAPIAAAVAALIASQHPTWHPFKVGEQLRATCDDINSVNPGFEDLLGRGRVNAHRAVSELTPGVRVVTQTFADANANGELNQGESVTLSLNLHNYLAPVTNLQLSLSTTSPWITITDAAEAAPDMLEDADAALPNAFTFTVHPSVPPGTRASVRVGMSGTGYADFQFIPMILEPVFETHDINNVRASVTGTGHLGWVGFAGGLGEKGEGFSFQGGENVLFEGALLLGTSATHLSDAARSSGARTDFAPVGNAPPDKHTPGTRADQEITSSYADAGNTATPLGVQVDMRSYAFASPPDDDFIVLEYRITNTTAAAMQGLRAGLWFDWDIDEAHYATNIASYEPTRQLGYAYDPAPGLPYVGILALSGSEAGYSAIRNDGVGQPFTINGTFTKAEKWLVLDGGTGITTAGPSDISFAMSSGPWLVEPGESVTAYYALVCGEDLPDLLGNADAARLVFADSIQTSVGELPWIAEPPPSRRLRLGEPVPNPFNPSTQFELEVDQARWVRVAVFDARGRLVRTLFEGQHPAGIQVLRWDGMRDDRTRVPSGVYFAELRARGRIDVRQLVLLK
jgi:hypothetical protein